jgi:hypothetical protein
MAVCIASDLDTEDLLRQLEVNRELEILVAERNAADNSLLNHVLTLRH